MDIIDSFMRYTENLPTPVSFRRWGAISMVGQMLARRVWTRSAGGIIYPNLFIMLVGNPAIGKGIAIKRVDSIWRETKAIHVAPQSMTKAALLDQLVSRKRSSS